MTVTRIHPETGETLKRDIRTQVVSFGSSARMVDVPGWYPDDGSDSIHRGEDLVEADRVFRQLRGV